MIECVLFQICGESGDEMNNTMIQVNLVSPILLRNGNNVSN